MTSPVMVPRAHAHSGPTFKSLWNGTWATIQIDMGSPVDVSNFDTVFTLEQLLDSVDQQWKMGMGAEAQELRRR